MAVEDWLLEHVRVAHKDHKRITLDDKIVFFETLSTLVSSGTPLLEAIQIAAVQNQSTRMRTILQGVAGRVAAGSSLHDVLNEHRDVFEDHWIELIGIGEVTGKMDMVLLDLNKQIRESSETRRKVKGALMYPIILLIVAVTVVVVMLWFVVPTFADMFNEMGAELPGITQFVLSASDFIAAKGLYMIGGVVVFVVAARKYMKTESGWRRVSSVGLTIPLVGELMVQAAMYRFASNLGLLLRSGVPMLETLSALGTVFRNSPIYRDAILRAHHRVAAGQSLTESLRESGLFTGLMVNMVSTGERSAQLSLVMEQIAPYYRERMQSFISKVTKLMEPFIIMVMGATIAGLMLAIYMPMFDMAGAVH
jgi:type II secretory pathway component PulF